MSEQSQTAKDVTDELREAIAEGAGKLAESALSEIERLRERVLDLESDLDLLRNAGGYGL